MGVAAIIYGSWVYLALIGVILVPGRLRICECFQDRWVQALRFCRLWAVYWRIHLVRYWRGTAWDAPLLVGLCAVGHVRCTSLCSLKKVGQRSAIDFAITADRCVFYLGILGSYFMLVRQLPHGMWWTFTILPAIWWGDTGAYFIGSWIGKHKFAPRLSPKKTWEGYFGGICFCRAGHATAGEAVLQPGFDSGEYGITLWQCCHPGAGDERVSPPWATWASVCSSASSA